jgi:hypothetical protein
MFCTWCSFAIWQKKSLVPRFQVNSQWLVLFLTLLSFRWTLSLSGRCDYYLKMLRLSNMQKQLFETVERFRCKLHLQLKTFWLKQYCFENTWLSLFVWTPRLFFRSSRAFKNRQLKQSSAWKLRDQTSNTALLSHCHQDWFLTAQD